MILFGQLTAPPVACPPPLTNKGLWPQEQLQPLLELEIPSSQSTKAELPHQIEQAGEHSWATAPTIVFLPPGVSDTATLAAVTSPNHAPFVTKGL